MQRNNLPFESEGIFVTNVISHVFMLFALRQLVQRRWIFEASTMAFACLSSFMYHTTQATQSRIFMSELQWHFLDNIGAVACFGVWLTYMTCLRDPFADLSTKIVIFMFAVVVQVPHPWDLQFTILPILFFFSMPVVSFVYRVVHHPAHVDKINISLARKAQFALSSVYNGREVAMGLSFLFVAVFFFALGLNEHQDPYRMYHGLWHVFGGLSTLHLWRMVKDPIAADLAAALEKVATESANNSNNNNIHLVNSLSNSNGGDGNPV